MPIFHYAFALATRFMYFGVASNFLQRHQNQHFQASITDKKLVALQVSSRISVLDGTIEAVNFVD